MLFFCNNKTYVAIIVVQLLFFLVSCLSVEVIEEKLKRSDVDLSTCIENFDIHKDKIIRTTDSRSMGAKYLNEIDLDSREECLRLCCETENCDVFVFEEKNTGSCYLFQCGPPEDFKCKFTHHVNYTSAVLAINRHLPDLESQIKLTKHEQDLSKLRKPETNNNNGNVEIVPAEVTTAQTTTSTTIKVKIASSELKTDSPLIQSRKCSNYQFECRSTGECIAIYNACDGIPQCADGSDEAPELRCPESSAPSTTTTAKTVMDVKSHENVAPVNLDSGDGARQVQGIPANDLYRPQMIPHLMPKMQQAPPSISGGDDFLRPMPDLHGQQQYHPQLQPPYQPYLPQPQPNWGQQIPQRLSQYPNKNSHIFNHKGNGLQVADVQDQNEIQYMGDGREYQKLPNYYAPSDNAYGQQIPQFQDNWPNQADLRLRNNQYNQNVNPGGRETWNTNVQQDPDKIVYNKPATKDVPSDWKSEKATNKHEQDKMAHELKHSKEHFASPPKSEQNKKLAIEYKLTSDTFEAIEDGVAETPSGAVLSLTLGLLITSMMAVLIGCRLRVVRRRLRRGGKSYAHDADYLVNGMYL